ncbi:dual specificity protein phosphatase 12-like isoform X1 [Acropora millepora]|uniref:dual specificity protein phosphatase 12-like isoform X1 n=1 Tax=Acropora millepora TaxID=45264 RepID=UPI001CF33A29|nr:dual specificity protein phosphatase 12-like isoform X1 [Acropora millepora]
MSFVKENLYIGSRADAIALANTRPSEEKTRILTVDLEPLRLENEDLMILKHVQCLDEHDSDLLSFFDDCSEFITDGIDKKENVLVHCLSGISRSSAVVLAYLMKTKGMSLDEALVFLQNRYPKANPNDGFVVQLQLYEAMGNTVDKTNPAYKEYRLKLLANQLQSVFNLISQQYGSKDLLSSVIKELKDTSSSAHKSYKCRKCRLLLFDTNSVLAHEPGSGQTSFKWQKQDLHKVDPKINTQCTSVFIEPVTWMLPLLEGTVDGKLLCPKCNGRLGSFNWAGMQCSCGKWVTPAFQIHKNRVDEVSHQLAPS